jgi:hypothetical protein
MVPFRVFRLFALGIGVSTIKEALFGKSGYNPSPTAGPPAM